VNIGNIRGIRLSRRAALRSLAAATVLSAALVAPFSSFSIASAQQSVDSSFSNTILPTLGLPELTLERNLDGLTGMPESIPAGRYLVNYSATDVVAYLLFAQHPTGLTDEQVLVQAREAGSNDQQQEGWVYGGGSNADPGQTVQVVVELPAGEWNVVTSAMPPDGNWETDEVYQIQPFTVTEATATPASSASPIAEIDAGVHVEMPGMAFVMDTDTVAAGPQIWEFANTGDQSHHMVMMRTPHLVTSDDMTALIDMFTSATPPAGDSWFLNSTWVGYTALVSPGFTVWNEFDLEPGTYVMLCFIADTETGMPHLMMGMWTPFTVK
jgi:plastocyanin